MKIWLVTAILALTVLPQGLANKDEATLDTVRQSYREWSTKLRQEIKSFASAQVQEIASKMEGHTVESLFKPETLEKLRTPLSQTATWHHDYSSHVRITEADGGTHIASPFLEADLPGVEVNQVTAAIFDAIMEDVDRVMEADQPDVGQLVEALLLTSVDAGELSIPETVILLAQVLGEIAAELDPVPPYSYDHWVREGDGHPIKYHDIVQDNYAKTLGSSQVVRTYYPLTREGVVNIVKKARHENARVRASGLKHSWNHWVWGVDNQYEDVDNPCYGPFENGDIDYFIGMIPYELSDPLFFIRADIEGWRSQAEELTFIEGPLDVWTEEDGIEHASVKVGAATLSMFLTQWANETGWMLPAEPMTPQFTLGGVVSTSSHGSGIQFPPVSEQVIAMEYVDEKGRIQVVDDPYELEAMSGAYGLFGIILSMTFKMNRVGFSTYHWKPIPRLENYMPRAPEPIPDYLVNIFETYYYQTWFMTVDFAMESQAQFPQMFENVFKEDGSPEEYRQLIPPFVEQLQLSMRFLQSTLHGIMSDALEEAGAEDYLYWLYMLAERQFQILVESSLPMPEPTVTTTAEAIHWIRGLHNYDIIRNFEVNVPIRDDGNGNPDWTTVQDIWYLYWDVVNTYEIHGIYPHDAPVELRFVAGSKQILSPYYDNPHGTFAVDVSCTKLVPLHIWNQLKNDLAFRFARFNTGGLRKPRYHVGKEMPVDLLGMSSADYFMETYADQVDMFKERFEQIVRSRGSSVRNTLQRFSTKFFDTILLDCKFKWDFCSRRDFWQQEQIEH